MLTAHRFNQGFSVGRGAPRRFRLHRGVERFCPRADGGPRKGGTGGNPHPESFFEFHRKFHDGEGIHPDVGHRLIDVEFLGRQSHDPRDFARDVRSQKFHRFLVRLTFESLRESHPRRCDFAGPFRENFKARPRDHRKVFEPLPIRGEVMHGVNTRCRHGRPRVRHGLHGQRRRPEHAFQLRLHRGSVCQHPGIRHGAPTDEVRGEPCRTTAFHHSFKPRVCRDVIGLPRVSD